MKRFRFGPFELDSAEMKLARHGIPVKIQDLPLRLLLMLVERPGDLVTREEVRHGLWPENTFVEFDNNLGVAVRKVREALGDTAEAPRYVATIPRRGYRFVAPVQVEELQENISQVEELPGPEPVPQVPAELEAQAILTAGRRRNTWIWGVGIAFFAGMAFLGLYRYGLQPKAQPTQLVNHVALGGPSRF